LVDSIVEVGLMEEETRETQAIPTVVPTVSTAPLIDVNAFAGMINEAATNAVTRVFQEQRSIHPIMTGGREGRGRERSVVK
jgi:predicted metalloprotease with PDZ domain